MSNSPKISVVIPLFNEAGTLAELYKKLSDVMKKYSYELIFVNDGSTDNSDTELEKFRSDPAAKILTHKKRSGKSAALSTGINNSHGKIFAFIDADLQNNPKDIEMMLDKLSEGFDLVHGWRKERKDGFLRLAPSRIANKIASWVTNSSFHDIGCGITVIRSDVLRKIKFSEGIHRWIPIIAFKNGARCTEVIVHHNARTYGKSKYGLLRIIPVGIDILTLAIFSKILPRTNKLIIILITLLIAILIVGSFII